MELGDEPEVKWQHIVGAILDGGLECRTVGVTVGPDGLDPIGIALAATDSVGAVEVLEHTVKDPGECFGVSPRPVTFGRALVADKCPLSIKERACAWNVRKSGVHCVSESDPRWA